MRIKPPCGDAGPGPSENQADPTGLPIQPIQPIQLIQLL
jgi:hypothetical protein